MGEQYLIPTAGRLEEIPPPSQREIVEIDLEQVDDRRSERGTHHQACQHCGDVVDLLEPHAWACLWVDDSIGRIMFKPVYCDRDCWLAWLEGG